jgi:hypothetical protein
MTNYSTNPIPDLSIVEAFFVSFIFFCIFLYLSYIASYNSGFKANHVMFLHFLFGYNDDNEFKNLIYDIAKKNKNYSSVNNNNANNIDTLNNINNKKEIISESAKKDVTQLIESNKDNVDFDIKKQVQIVTQTNNYIDPNLQNENNIKIESFSNYTTYDNKDITSYFLQNLISYFMISGNKINLRI